MILRRDAFLPDCEFLTCRAARATPAPATLLSTIPRVHSATDIMQRINAAIAIVVRDDRLLICQRRHDDTFGGSFEFPGGKCEEGETLEACLARELMEELRIVATPIQKLAVVEHDYPHAKLRLHPFLCEHVHGEPQPIECARAMWIDPATLPSFTFPPANESLLQEVMARLSRR
jgi:mutator protein MutT